MKKISKRQEQAAAAILREFAERVELRGFKEFVLELNVYALRKEKEGLGAKRRKVSLMNSFISFLDKIESWQVNNHEEG